VAPDLLPAVSQSSKGGSWLKFRLVLSANFGVHADGEPTGESSDAVRSTIKSAKKALTGSQYGPGAVAFSFAQVSSANFVLLYPFQARLLW